MANGFEERELPQPPQGALFPSVQEPSGTSTPPTTGIPDRLIVLELKRRGVSEKLIAQALANRPPGVLQSIARDLPEIAGATAMVAAAPTGVGILPAAGLAALGAAGGKGLQLAGQQLGGQEMTSGEAAGEMAGAGIRNAIGEGTGRVVFGVAGKALKPLANRILPQGREFMDFMAAENLRQARKHGARVLPSQVADSSLLDFISNYGEGSLLGSRFYRLQRERQVEVLNQATDDLVRALGRTMDQDELGRTLALVAKGQIDVRKDLASAAFNKAIGQGKGVIVDVRALKAEAARIKRAGVEFTTQQTKEVPSVILDASGKSAGTTTVTSSRVVKQPVRGREFGDDVLDNILRAPDQVPLEFADRMRKRISARSRALQLAGTEGEAVGVLNSLEGTAIDQVESAFAKQRPDLLDVWREGRQIRKEAAELNGKFVAGLIRQLNQRTGGRPERVMRDIFRRENITQIKAIRNLVEPNDPDAWKTAQRWFIDDVIRPHAKADGTIDGAAALDAIYGRAGIGEKAAREIFATNPQDLDRFTKVMRAWKTATEKRPGATDLGKVAVQLQQAGAVLTLAGVGAGILPSAAATGASMVIIAPDVLARLMTSKTGSRLLTEGFSLPAKGPKAAGLVTRLMAEAIKVRQEQLAEDDAFFENESTVEIMPSGTAPPERAERRQIYSAP